METPKNERSGLTNQEAEELLKKLTKHFNEPVLPLSKFCGAMRQWFGAIGHNNEDPSMLDTMHGKNKPEYQFGSAYYKELGHINIDISKSYLLARLIYEDEPLRTEKCPVHKGHWDGQTQLLCGCTYGCDGSGWLKTPELVQAALVRFRKHSRMTDEEVIAKAKAGDLPVRDEKESFAYYAKRYIFEWLYHLGQLELVPESERG